MFESRILEMQKKKEQKRTQKLMNSEYVQLLIL